MREIFTAWMVVSEDRRQAIVAVYKVLNDVNCEYRRLKLHGLAEETVYRIREDGCDKGARSGNELMRIGMVTTDDSAGERRAETAYGDFYSRIFVLEGRSVMTADVNYRKTIYACFVGYIVQAIVNNFVPLLFVTFQGSYGIPLSKITMLITLNFVIQLLVDLLSAAFVDRIGYRASILIAHACAAVGLVGLAFLPDLLTDPFAGLLISVVVYAVGGGLLEVLVSPIIEACPTENKEKAMSLLHSFYCWGHVGVVLISTLFFALFGIENWKILALVWALFPIVNGILFAGAPIRSLKEEGESGMSLRDLASSKVFWIMMLMMLSAGASEQAVSQWASTFAEAGLGVTKAVGDLAGPMAFAFLMGDFPADLRKIRTPVESEPVYGRQLPALHFLLSVDCMDPGSVPWPGGLCGLWISVGILWPGTFSKASAAIRGGGNHDVCAAGAGRGSGLHQRPPPLRGWCPAVSAMTFTPVFWRR